MVTIEQLIDKILSYNPNANIERIKKAFIFSREAHCAQKRIEGSPYIYHPLAVAFILAEMHLDSATIAAGLLHDTIEDTDMSPNDIKDMFGSEIAFLVESVTKLSKVEFKTEEDAQAENFRKMFLAMSKDVRVILIKFADRLHNIRTIEFLPPEKQRRIAKETLEIYAPLANRLGIYWLKVEFEDACFKILMPEVFKELQEKVAKYVEVHNKFFEDVKESISEKLKAHGIEATIKSRIKNYYSIYNKIIKQKIPFEQVYDVIGVRIITDTVPHCYEILSIIHSLWPHIPGRFKDFISVPKANMYESLHTTVIGPMGYRMEFQIRTKEMDLVAEEGIAAHWRYKEKDTLDSKNARYVEWLRVLIKEISDAKEFLTAVKEEVTPDTIYVFTPKGDIKELPVGSTPIDFAYSIHTEVGNKCIGAKVNGRILPLRQKLNSGDVVEIITSASQTPSKDWLKYVVTQRAKTKIRQWLRNEERKQGINLGINLLESELKRRSLPLSILKSEKMSEILKAFAIQSLEDLYLLIGFGKVSAPQIVNRLMPEKPEDEVTLKVFKQPQLKKSAIKIKGIDNVLYHIGKCCYPVPGDNVIGFITKGKGVTIHRDDCINLLRQSITSERLIDVEWHEDGDFTSQAKLSIEALDRPGILASLSSIISAANVNISYVKANTTSDKRAIIELILEIKNKNQLSDIQNKISQLKDVVNVDRR